MAFARELSIRRFALGLCATTRPVFEGAYCAALDVTDGPAVDRFAGDVARELGPIDVWINNAAVLGPIGPVRTSDRDAWRRCIDVNIQGVVNASRAFLAQRRAGAGTLVNIASRAAVAPAAGLAAYSATKAAVVALTIAIAEEERGSCLRAVAVLPPSVNTDMQDALLSQDDSVFPHVHLSRQRKRDGGVLPAAVAAKRILEAVLADDQAASTVVDLSALTI
jgi:NAD(P)-dependent dehydrogenase (short-subunit alcohol dehydrogenase family)